MKEYEGYKGPLSKEQYYGIKRLKLGFEETVLQHFQFLVDEYGFRCVFSGLIHVEYESEMVFFGIYHDVLQGGELETSLRLIEKDRRISYSLIEIMVLQGKEDLYHQLENKSLEDGKYKWIGASTAEEVRKYVPIIADLLKKYALPAIQGDANFYGQLDKVQKKMSHETMLNVKPTSEMEKAWENRDYKYYIKLGESWKRYLTTTEQERLEYARKQAGSQ